MAIRSWLDAELGGQRRGGVAHGLDADGGRVGAPFGRGLARELDPFDGAAAGGHGVVDGHQARLIAARTRSRRQDEAGGSTGGHGPIVLDRPGPPDARVTQCTRTTHRPGRRAWLRSPARSAGPDASAKRSG